MRERTEESPGLDRARRGLSPLWAVTLMIACERPETAATRSPETVSMEAGPIADGGPSQGSIEPERSVVGAAVADPGEPGEASAGEASAKATEPCGAEAIPEEVAAILGPIEGLEFEVNKWTIRSKSYRLLDGIVEVLQRYPEVAIEIGGHRDDDPHWRERAVDITRKRAEALREYLIEQGVDSGRLTSQGYGPDRPLAPNDTKENRALNRRIELRVLEAKSSLPSCTDEPGA